MASELRLLPLQTTPPGVFSLYITNIYLTELTFEVNKYFQMCMLQKKIIKMFAEYEGQRVRARACVCDPDGVAVATALLHPTGSRRQQPAQPSAILSRAASGARTRLLLVSRTCPFWIISSRMMWTRSRLNMIWCRVKDAHARTPEPREGGGSCCGRIRPVRSAHRRNRVKQEVPPGHLTVGKPLNAPRG